MNDYLSTQAEQELCREVYDCMDASNLSGLLLFWAERVNPVILSACRTLGRAPNCHPFNVMLADKLSQLSMGDGRGMGTMAAYSAVHAVAYPRKG